MKRKFKGVWIPAPIWLNKSINIMEKVFLVEIDSLDNDNGCFASNAYFSDFFGITKGRCSQIIKSLKDKNFISIEYTKEGQQIIHRIIKVVNKLTRVVNNCEKGSKFSKGGYLENDQDSNTLVNNTKNNNKYSVSEMKEIFEHYMSLKLINHRSLTKDMMKCMNLFRSNTSASVLECKEALDRHKNVCEKSNSGDYPIKKRSIMEFFGQKVFNASHLIGSEYLSDGKYGEVVKEEGGFYEDISR
jgi:hypothetical protein